MLRRITPKSKKIMFWAIEFVVLAIAFGGIVTKVKNSHTKVESGQLETLDNGMFQTCTLVITDEVSESIGKYVEDTRNASAYLIDELIYEMGSEIPLPTDFFDLSREVHGTVLMRKSVESFKFETELTDEILCKRGKYIIKINCNGTVVDGHLSVVDTTPPTIDVPENTEYCIGDTILYRKGVTVTDNSKEELEVMLDNSAVKSNMAGSYPVYYSAVDSAGNVGKATAEITIKKEHEPTEDEVNQLADEVLSVILEDGMTQLEQAKAIFEWCYHNIRYTADADKSSLIQGAYDGICHRMGDCFTYYATGAYLMNRCGIENLAVSRKDEYVTHYWSLVNLGEGWYHFDCSPHINGYKCFMQTDAQVKEYAQMYEEDENYFVFDEAQMPLRSDNRIFSN